MTQKIRKLLVPLSGIFMIAVMPRPLGAQFIQHNLVSDIPGLADFTDPNLRNPWGIAASSTSPFWVTDQRTGVSTIYGGDGSIVPLVVTIPPRPGGTTGSPTGIVFNDSSDFVLANGNPARFIFASLDGTLSAWNSGTQAELKATTGASYTGLAIAPIGGHNFLYAANVAGGRIDVFDGAFKLTPFGLAPDPDLPAGFSPFNIQNLNGTLYVTFLNSADREHGGVVDAFDTNGNFLQRIATDGPLNAPWGLALAPRDFGPFRGSLLVGNFGFGDGTINAFDLKKGEFLGQLQDAAGNPIQIEGLWGLSFGNGASSEASDLYFAAGINRTGPGSFGAADGLFGRLEPVP